MKFLRNFVTIVIISLILSCDGLENGRVLVFDGDLSFKEIMKRGYQKVPVDLNMFEKRVNDSVSHAVIFDDDLEYITIATWTFYMQKSYLGKKKTMNVLNRYNLSLITPICEYDSIYSFFSAVDDNNRVLAGKKVLEDTVQYVELSYYYPVN